MLERIIVWGLLRRLMRQEPGDFEVMIGTNSRDVKTAKFTLN